MIFDGNQKGKSIGKNDVTRFDAVEREKNILLLGKDKFDWKYVDMDNLYDLLQELSEEYARHSNQREFVQKYNEIPMSQTTAYITSNDDNYSRYGD